MNWLEKVEKLQNFFESSPMEVDAFFRQSQWLPGEMDTIKNLYPFLHDNFLKFIKKFDGCDIAFVVFYGSHHIPTFSQNISKFQHLLKDKYFPFGNDISGNIYMLNMEGQVVQWIKDDYNFEQSPKVLASSFEEFIGDCLLGKRYSEFEFTDNNSFFEFMKSQGWV